MKNAKGEDVHHSRRTCPWLVAQQTNLPEKEGVAPLNIDIAGVTPSLRATVAGCIDSLASVSMSTGANLKGKEAADLVAMLGAQEITFPEYKVALMEKMAAEKDTDKMSRLAMLLTAGAAGMTQRSAEPPVAAGMPKVGVREKVFNSLLRKARADYKHLGSPAAATARTMKVTAQGEAFYETNDTEPDICSMAMYTVVTGWLRHAYLGVGLATEHALHFFFDWHAQRLLVGDALVVVQRTMRLLVRLVDTGTRDWMSVVEQDGGLILEMTKAAALSSTKPATKVAPGASLGAEVPEEKERNAPGTAAATCCKRYNTVDPEQPGISLPCLYRKKDGSCKYKHTCSKIMPDGSECGQHHPAWQHHH